MFTRSHRNAWAAVLMVAAAMAVTACGGSGGGTKVPELLLCGDADVVAPCDMSDGVYNAIGAGTPKMQITIPGATHFNWFGPTDTSNQLSGKYALAFEKVYLEGDTRWKTLLMSKAPGATIKSAL